MKVLVVDDEKVVRDGCHRVLSAKGFDKLSGLYIPQLVQALCFVGQFVRGPAQLI